MVSRGGTANIRPKTLPMESQPPVNPAKRPRPPIFKTVRRFNRMRGSLDVSTDEICLIRSAIRHYHMELAIAARTPLGTPSEFSRRAQLLGKILTGPLRRVFLLRI